MGGVSNERKVSIKSGKAIAAALAQAGHQVFPVDVTRRNVDELDDIAPDVVFVALHGEFGEDGEVQRLLEQKGIPYTGSEPEASRMGMDKIASKRAFIRNSVPTPDYLVVADGEDLHGASAQSARLGFPLVCKPAIGGSSIGVSIVRSGNQLPSAIESASCYPVLVERYVPGRELTIGILDGEPLPIVEVVPRQEFFNYEAKYTDENTQYTIPISLLESIYRKAQEVALRAYNALGCRHLARVDLINGYDGNLYVLEVNTIPGFTPRSLLPMAARYVGLHFAELCERIAQMALRDAAASRIDEFPARKPKRHTA